MGKSSERPQNIITQGANAWKQEVGLEESEIGMKGGNGSMPSALILRCSCSPTAFVREQSFLERLRKQSVTLRSHFPAREIKKKIKKETMRITLANTEFLSGSHWCSGNEGSASKHGTNYRRKLKRDFQHLHNQVTSQSVFVRERRAAYTQPENSEFHFQIFSGLSLYVVRDRRCISAAHLNDAGQL